MPRTNRFEQFLMFFNTVKSAALNEPSRIRTFYTQHENLRTAVDTLFMFMNFGDFERWVLHSPRKYHVQTPQGFEEAFNDYREKWQEPVETAALLRDRLSEIDEETSNKIFNLLKKVREPDPELDEDFDPLRHDGAKALAMMVEATQTYAELNENFYAEIGLQAYDYLTDTIGLDIDGVFRRWRNVPPIFMPAHVSNAHGLTERGSLYDLIDDAVRAYVFGAPGAAIAACRAALEMVLKRHYGLDYQRRRKDGRMWDKGLGELIVLADEKYEFVQKQRLERLTNDANDIMHDYTRRKRISEKDEETILEFLMTVKFMIEHAPA